ncbi:unnamed protein product, partial [Amoebophrya sp. A120]|eukprot:GSA120T00006468001.1
MLRGGGVSPGAGAEGGGTNDFMDLSPGAGGALDDDALLPQEQFLNIPSFLGIDQQQVEDSSGINNENLVVSLIINTADHQDQRVEQVRLRGHLGGQVGGNDTVMGNFDVP